MKLSVFAVTCAALAADAGASNIYLLSSGDPATDSAAVAALTSRGHTVTTGVTFDAFDGTVDLTAYQTVYLQCNYNWTSIAMPEPGQQQLIAWVNAGGRLVTSEWVVYYTYAGGKFSSLGAILPLTQTFSYGSLTSESFAVATPDPAINAGVPANFTCSLFSYTGTETYAAAKPGATIYYTITNSATAAGLAGWSIGNGKAFSFTSTCGPDQVNDASFGQLFSNVMGATGGTTCYPNCDASTTPPVLNVLDFSCFLNKFAAGESVANCDHSTTPPVLNVLDFSCFLNAFAAGCT